jgi:serine/threonine protein kinase
MNDNTSLNPEKIGKYVIEDTLGAGAMGVVYKGLDPDIGRPVAIKVIKKNNLDSENSEEIICRFKREAQAAGSLSHPTIATIYEFGESESVLFLAMEYVEGRDLADRLKMHERFPLENIGNIITQLLDALHYSHQNSIVHRDIKPANIMIKENSQIKIMDFGIARLESSELTQIGTMIGTPSYMAPEQFMGHPIDHRVDIYASGVILYQLLTGEKPFYGENVTTIMHKVINVEHLDPTCINMQLPVAFNYVLKKALAKRVEDRFQTVLEFKNALIEAFQQIYKSHVDAESSVAPPPPPPQESSTHNDETLTIIDKPELNKTIPPTRNYLKFLAIGGLIIVVVIGLIYWFTGSNTTKQQAMEETKQTAGKNLAIATKNNKIDKKISQEASNDKLDKNNSEPLPVKTITKQEPPPEESPPSKTAEPVFSFKNSTGSVQYIAPKKSDPKSDQTPPPAPLKPTQDPAIKSPIQQLSDDEW